MNMAKGGLSRRYRGGNVTSETVENDAPGTTI